MRTSTSIKSSIVFIMSALPSIVHGSPKNLTSTDSLFLMSILSGFYLLLPHATLGGTSEFGNYAWIQVLIILSAVLTARFLLQKSLARTRTYVIVLPIVYVMFTLGTNIQAWKYRFDRPDINKTLSKISLGSTEEEIHRIIGTPVAAARFTTTDYLPGQVIAELSNKQIKDSYIIVYEDKPQNQRKNNKFETVYYLVLDPTTHRMMSRIAIGGFGGFSGMVAGKWPYN